MRLFSPYKAVSNPRISSIEPRLLPHQMLSFLCDLERNHTLPRTITRSPELKCEWGESYTACYKHNLPSFNAIFSNLRFRQRSIPLSKLHSFRTEYMYLISNDYFPGYLPHHPRLLSVEFPSTSRSRFRYCCGLWLMFCVDWSISIQ